jgi:homoserine O-succinyltransferase/O-acetyltransferase
MSLIIEGGCVPTRWAEGEKSRAAVPVDNHRRPSHGLSLAFINNMPDAALEDTELQFFELLDLASGETPVYVKLYSLRGIPRAKRGLDHLGSFYSDFDELWLRRIDGAIITGTEPHKANLQDEPYWKLLGEVFDWAGRNNNSTILSCLAAHASVLHNDGIPRHRLPDKQFGVFQSRKSSSNHQLTENVSEVVCFPHSRWNEVQESELASAGYTVITKSQDAGVDLFAKKQKRSLFVHFQGHPEYNADTLLKEYRRDIKRYLRGERDSYPSMPQGYFSEQAAQVLMEFQHSVTLHKGEEAMASFPESAIGDLYNPWKSSAVSVYRNWLHYLLSAREERARFVSMPVFREAVSVKQPAV